MKSPPKPNSIKHRDIYQAIAEEIQLGKLNAGDQLPTEHQLTRQFNVSRSTVIRALRDLEQEGLIQRRQGSGSFVQRRPVGTSVGFMVPGMDPESVFVGVQQQFLRYAGLADWRVVSADMVIPGDVDAAGNRPVEVAKELVARGIKGVILVPHHVGPEGDELNRRTLEVFSAAGVCVVLLDRDFVDYPRRSQYDLVSVDHEGGGQLLGDHLLSLGCHRVVFVGEPLRYPSPRARLAGLRQSLDGIGGTLDVRFGVLDNAGFVQELMALGPDAVVCDNDQDAAILMRGLLRAGVRIPQDILLAGFDDRPVARLLAVPLTTVAQPTASLAIQAVSLLRARMENPDLAPATCLVQGQLIVRASTVG